ncbi:outer membrane protein [Agrobacterium sp. ES01]|uniref:outer membrane protein n=1 Tax=Agrobacterium sp. ES01 TaxID=3420714 RepID=UPI003D0C87C5
MTMKPFAMALAATLSATSAMAADLTPYQEPPAYNEPAATSTGFTGAYVGIHAGVAGDTLNPFSGDNGLAAGVHGGYNTELGGAIVGGEVELSHMGDAEVDVSGGQLRERQRLALKAKAGVALDETLLYGTAGLAMTNLRDGRGVEGPDGWKPGLLLGVGVEQNLTDQISASVEYNYVSTGDVRSFNGVTTTENDISDHTVKAGLNYKF